MGEHSHSCAALQRGRERILLHLEENPHTLLVDPKNPSSIKVTSRCVFFFVGFLSPSCLVLPWFCYFSTSPKRIWKNPAFSVPRRNAGSSTVPLRTVKFAGALQGKGAKDADGGRNQAKNLGGAIKPSQKEDERIGSGAGFYT